MNPKMCESGSKRPVTGWLVCIAGDLRGTMFELHGGENRIGGAADMDISLAMDSQLSSYCQVVISYEPVTREFFTNPGSAKELSYVNDQVILFKSGLKNRDILQVGGTRFLFIPLCGANFAWEEL